MQVRRAGRRHFVALLQEGLCATQIAPVQVKPGARRSVMPPTLVDGFDKCTRATSWDRVVQHGQLRASLPA